MATQSSEGRPIAAGPARPFSPDHNNEQRNLRTPLQAALLDDGLVLPQQVPLKQVNNQLLGLLLVQIPCKTMIHGWQERCKWTLDLYQRGRMRPRHVYLAAQLIKRMPTGIMTR